MDQIQSSNESSKPNPEEWARKHDEISNTLRRTMLTLIGYSFFCILSLLAPDSYLVLNTANLTVPLVNIKIKYSDFLIVGPIILIGLAAYIHVFFNEWLFLEPCEDKVRLPYIFNLKGAVPKWSAYFIFYFIPSIILCFFALKALPLFKLGITLIFLLVIFSASVSYLAIKQLKKKNKINKVSKKKYIIIFQVLTILLTAVFIFQLIYLFLGKGLLITRKLNLFSAELRNSNLVDADLQKANMIRADLTKANLENAKLNSADLEDADLHKARLKDAELIKANLPYAAMNNTVLRRADFTNAILKQATLKEADLEDADLKNADLKNANLSGANFKGTNLKEADLEGANIQGAKNLTCEELKKAKNWELSKRDRCLTCN